MKEDLIKNLSAALDAMNNINVKGKPNLANLYGSIAIIENAVQALMSDSAGVDDKAQSARAPKGDDNAGV